MRGNYLLQSSNLKNTWHCEP